MRSLSVLSVLLVSALAVAGPALAAPPPAPQGYKWSPNSGLSDEFNGPTLDQTKWVAVHPYWKGPSPSKFNPQNVSLSGGDLVLRSTVNPSAKPGGDWVWAACVSSRQPVVQFGYYEARVKASKLSMTSSFWMQGRDVAAKTAQEIDVIEAVGASKNFPRGGFVVNPTTHHFENQWAVDRTERTRVEMSSPVTEWHTYGVWWRDPHSILIYLDGALVGELHPKDAVDKPMYLFFDTEVHDAVGLPEAAALRDPSRNAMYVDWVRAYTLVRQ